MNRELVRARPLLLGLLPLVGDSCESVRRSASRSTSVLDDQARESIDCVVEQAIRECRMPGCVVAVGNAAGIDLLETYGVRALQPSAEPMTADTVFDLASLTKPIATAASVMRLVERGELRLEDPVGLHLSEFAAAGKGSITVRHLLTHCGGLPADNDLEDYSKGSEAAWQKICAIEPLSPPGEVFLYSDVGFIVLGKLVELRSGRSLDAFATEELFAPLRMDETTFHPGEELRARAAPTERREGHWMRGEVHDPRAHLLSGVAGHAGLFSTAKDLSRFARMLLCAGRLEGACVLSPRTIELMTAPHEVGGEVRGLGWDIHSRYSKNRGELFSERAFGHGGFTGTSFWVDPGLDLFVIFLSNRVHPDGKGNVNLLAGRIGSIAAAACSKKRAAEGIEAGGSGEDASPGGRDRARDSGRAREWVPVLTGIDVLVRDGFTRLQGRRVGLITNPTGISRDGRRTIDLLKNAPGVELLVLFSPEHGAEGIADDAVQDSLDTATGLPIHSLYGEHNKPTAQMLSGLDTLAFDVQDVGTRFYTYVSTMGLCLEAAAEHGLRLVVLDRPNPINGVDVAGPLVDPGRECFVAFHSLPVRHGMTLGELARMFQVERNLAVDLEIVAMEGWRRDMFFDETGLLWVNPSPNMRSLDAALLYPGIGLLEMTNLSVGRGTEAPFEIVGAPWLDAAVLCARLLENYWLPIGVTPVRFTPTASVFTGELCQGLRLDVLDREGFDPLELFWDLAQSLIVLHGDRWQMQEIDRLLLNSAALEQLIAGVCYDEASQTWDDDLGLFCARREPFLRY